MYVTAGTFVSLSPAEPNEGGYMAKCGKKDPFSEDNPLFPRQKKKREPFPPVLPAETSRSSVGPDFLSHEQYVGDGKADQSGGDEPGHLRPNEQQALGEGKGAGNRPGRLLHR